MLRFQILNDSRNINKNELNNFHEYISYPVVKTQVYDVKSMESNSLIIRINFLLGVCELYCKYYHLIKTNYKIYILNIPMNDR